jgi:putative transposase
MTIATTVTATELESTKTSDQLPTIWQVPDDLWAEVKAILDRYDPAKRVGRKRIDQRKALDGIIFRMRSGCQWNQLPKEFGDDSSVHRTFQRWQRLSIFDRIWATLQVQCDELGGVDWEWQAADTMLGKARFGGGWLARTRRTGQRRAPRRAF